MGKRKWPLELCRITYQQYDAKKHKVHPPNDEALPPPPANGWCVRKVVDPDGTVVEEKLYPWLDETKDKLIYIGVGIDDEPVTAPHLKFDSPYYITKIEHCPLFDEKGEQVLKWYNEESEEVEEPDDKKNPPKGWTAKTVFAFSYVVGVDSITWMGEHMFRMAANLVPGVQQLNKHMAYVVNNTGNAAKMMAMAVQHEHDARGQGG